MVRKDNLTRRSRRSQPPAADGTVAEGALAIPGVLALTRTIHRVLHNLTTVEVVYTEALWDPSRDELPAEIGSGARSLGTLRQVLQGPRCMGLPQVIHLHVTFYEVPQDDGTNEYMAPVPGCFHPQTGIHQDLAAEITVDLPHFGIDALARRSFVLPDEIVALAEAHAAANWEAIRRDRFKPVCLGVDTVHLSRSTGDRRKALHVTAADPARGIYCTLALIEFLGNEQEPVIEALVALLKQLPHLEALLATATDDSVERGMVAAAVERVQAERPELNPVPVFDIFHILGSFVKVLNRRRIAVQGQWKDHRTKTRREAANLLRQMNRTLVKTRWSVIELDADRKAKMEYLFELSQELEEGFFIVDGLRRLFDCRSLEAADRAYAAWRRELAKVETRAYATKAAELHKKWEHVRRIFEVFEKSDALHDHLMSFGTNPVESLNERVKEVWEGARNSSIELIALRLIADQGYIAKSMALSEPTLVRRKRKFADLHPRRRRAQRRRQKRLGSAAAPA